MNGCLNARQRSSLIETGNAKKAIKRARRCIVYKHSTLISLVTHPVLAILILLGGPSITSYHVLLIIKPLLCALNRLSRWFGIDADWCVLTEAGLGIEAANSPSHLVASHQCSSIHIIFLV